MIGALASPVLAEDAEKDEKSELVDKKDLAEAKTNLINAEKALVKAKFGLDDLPKFENKTELKDKGGEIEAALLTSAAVDEAAAVIAGKVSGSHVLVLTGSTQVDFNLPFVLKHELESLKSSFVSIPGVQPAIECGVRIRTDDDGPRAGGAGLTAIIPFISALSGLLGTETTVTGVVVGIDDNQLATALAGKLAAASKTVRLYHHDAGRLSADQLKNNKIAKLMTCLNSLRMQSGTVRDGQPKKKKQNAKIDATITSFDNLATQITKAGDDGRSTYVRAILLDQYNDSANDYKTVRVKADKSGGSLVHNKNIWTTFGVDPLKVSGGLLVSYSIVDRAGNVISGGRLACQTNLASLRKIQSGKWRNSGQSKAAKASCQ